MKLKIFKKGFNYSQDGPGNRLVYHLQGCNMKCRWCANPESISGEGALMVERAKLLEAVCPYGAIKGNDVERDICRDCEAKPCTNKNKNEGIWLSCFEMSVEDIVDEAKESKDLFFDGGGITFSGGEPTYQFKALKEALIKLKETGISTAIETNGTHAQLEEVFPYVDTLIVDLKHVDDDMHKRFTGVSNQEIKRNIAKAMNKHPNLLIRTPLIEGFNAKREYIGQFIEFYKQFNYERTCFEILRYHEYGKEKWEQCGMTYKMHDGHIGEGVEEIFETEYKANGLMVVRT